jgi:hypothetical protein
MWHVINDLCQSYLFMVLPRACIIWQKQSQAASQSYIRVPIWWRTYVESFGMKSIARHGDVVEN